MAAYTAAAAFVRRIGQFAQDQPAWAERIVYETKPDEEWDMTKAALRVYGTPDEWLTIMAAACLDSIEQPMTPRTLVLPTLPQLMAIKAATGYSIEPFDRTAEQAANPILAR
jgi:phage terminase large subunit-like protein